MEKEVIRHFRWFEAGVLAGSGRPTRPEQIEWLRDDQDIRAIISLVPVNQEVQKKIKELGIRHLELIIADYSVPSEHQIAEFFKFMDEMLQLKRSCLVHCFFGKGRTGTMGALYLVRQGIKPEQAIALIGTLESDWQTKLVYNFAK